jgi:hypothetical protein
MTQKQVIIGFCCLSKQIAGEAFDFQEPADCFCGDKPIDVNFQFSQKVMDFIKIAVKEKIQRELDNKI